MSARSLSLLLAVGFLAAAPLARGVRAQGAPEKPVFKLEGHELLLPSPVLFKAGTDQLEPESEKPLQHVLAYLKEKRLITTLRIEGHLDNEGSASALQTLSEKRSLAVGKWLVEHGVECKRVLPVGFGATKPVADNATPEGRAKNRRISFVNAALAGRLIGGMPADGGGKLAGDPCAK